MRKIRLLGSAASVAVLTLVLAAPTYAAGARPPLDRLVELNPGTSVSEMRAELEASAAELGVTYDEILAQALTEAEAAEVTKKSGSGTSSSPGGGGKMVTIGMANGAGDVFHSWAKTAGVTHNHAGIYHTIGTIVEAPGGGNLSWSRDAATHRVYAAAYKMQVNTTQSNRDNAGKYAYEKLRFKPYQSNFAFNKNGDDSKLNCSELVWLAYVKSTGIDLDSNGGWGVYPNDIKNSSHISIYSEIR